MQFVIVLRQIILITLPGHAGLVSVSILIVILYKQRVWGKIDQSTWLQVDLIQL